VGVICKALGASTMRKVNTQDIVDITWSSPKLVRSDPLEYYDGEE